MSFADTYYAELNPDHIGDDHHAFAAFMDLPGANAQYKRKPMFLGKSAPFDVQNTDYASKKPVGGKRVKSEATTIDEVAAEHGLIVWAVQAGFRPCMAFVLAIFG